MILNRLHLILLEYNTKMFFPILLCLTIVPISHGNTNDKIEGNTTSAGPLIKNLLKSELKEKNVTVISEGEVILSNTPVQTLPKEDKPFPITYTADAGNNKVKPRKGAFLDVKNINMEETPQLSNSSLQPLHIQTTLNTITTISNTTKGKPTILSAEAIAKSDLLNNDPALDDDQERMVKIHKLNTSGRPAMIMPILITVLVVPMFAVIGYMALRRGQEAWKNRHYKRMDFLLDGMYND